MHELIAQLDAIDATQLTAWTVSQLRGENPSGLRSRYEAPHAPLAAIYRFLEPSTRESLQNVIYELMRSAAAGRQPRGVPVPEIFALVDPLYNSSALQPQVRTLLLALVNVGFQLAPQLRHPVLLALLRNGYRGSVDFWKSQLRGPDDEALVIILQGLAQASVRSFFATLAELPWSFYIADCVTSIVPGLVEEHGEETVLPQLFRTLRDVSPDLRRPLLALVGASSVPVPYTVEGWTAAIGRYVAGHDDAPWEVLETAKASPRLRSFFEEGADFETALEYWISRWLPGNSENDLRVVRLVQRYPSAQRLAAVIGAMQTYRVAEESGRPLLGACLETISGCPAIAQQLWWRDPNLARVYGSCLADAKSLPATQELAMRELVRWVRNPEAAPFYEMIEDEKMTVNDVGGLTERETGSREAVVAMMYEVHQRAIKRGKDDIATAIFVYDETLAPAMLELQKQRSVDTAVGLLNYLPTNLYGMRQGSSL